MHDYPLAADQELPSTIHIVMHRSFDPNDTAGGTVPQSALLLFNALQQTCGVVAGNQGQVFVNREFA
jgi:hypothetical protein